MHTHASRMHMHIHMRMRMHMHMHMHMRMMHMHASCNKPHTQHVHVQASMCFAIECRIDILCNHAFTDEDFICVRKIMLSSVGNRRYAELGTDFVDIPPHHIVIQGKFIRFSIGKCGWRDVGLAKLVSRLWDSFRLNHMMAKRPKLHSSRLPMKNLRWRMRTSVQGSLLIPRVDDRGFQAQ